MGLAMKEKFPGNVIEALKIVKNRENYRLNEKQKTSWRYFIQNILSST